MAASPKALVATCALAIVLVVAATAGAYLVSFATPEKCSAGKLRAVGKGAAAALRCHARNVADPDPIELAACLAKVAGKTSGTFAKLDEKYGSGCPGPNGDGGARANDGTSFAADVNGDVGSASGKCDAAKHKCVGSYVARVLGCYAKAASTLGSVDGECPTRAASKLADGVRGCLDKAVAAGDCTNANTQSAALRAGADAFVDGQACLLDPSAVDCSVIPTPTPTATPPCPASVEFTNDVAAAGNDFDWGWTGIGHEVSFGSGRTVTVAVTGISGNDCVFAGPIANVDAGAGAIDNQRCTENTAVRCTNAPGGIGGACTGLGTCEFHWGPPMGFAFGGISLCILDRVVGPVTGTVNPVSGALARSMTIARVLYSPVSSYDVPCPRCMNDATANDGVADGTCSDGARDGLACDANGSTPTFPDSGVTSFDCPPFAIDLIGHSTHTMTGSTGVASLTLSSASPTCWGDGHIGERCACDTCNNAAANVCADNADCPPSGGQPGICGGRRCLGGSNHGAACTAVSSCPGAFSCGRLGQPTKPHHCNDDTIAPGDGSLCVDSAPVGDEHGLCPEGPIRTDCSAASGHPQRGCLADSDCCDDAPDCVVDPVTPGDCTSSFFACFLDNGVAGNAIRATGVADPPSGGLAAPTIAATYCVGLGQGPFLDAALGMPGPTRATTVEVMKLLP